MCITLLKTDLVSKWLVDILDEWKKTKFAFEKQFSFIEKKLLIIKKYS